MDFLKLNGNRILQSLYSGVELLNHRIIEPQNHRGHGELLSIKVYTNFECFSHSRTNPLKNLCALCGFNLSQIRYVDLRSPIQFKPLFCQLFLVEKAVNHDNRVR